MLMRNLMVPALVHLFSGPASGSFTRIWSTFTDQGASGWSVANLQSAS
jgi:hypothetical protein